MKILGFVEGSRPGGFGLVGVPMILSSLGQRGHQVALILAGRVNPGREHLLVPSVQSAYERSESSGRFGIVSMKAWTNWAFTPHIWRVGSAVKGADFVSLHSLYSFPVLVGYLLARYYGKPYCLWPHGVLAPCQRRVSSARKWVYDRAIGRRILNNAAVLLFSASGEREEAGDMGITTPGVVVPHGFDATEFMFPVERGKFRGLFFSHQEGPLVVCLSRLNAKKGLDLLIRAMAQVISKDPAVRLAIIGPSDPPSFGRQVLRWVNESAIGANTVITGPIDPEMKRCALADADVYALASQAENFGFSLFEAMASCVPVVVSETLDYATEISRVGAGLSVQRTPERFAEAIQFLLKNPELREAMGERGLRLAQKYSWAENGRVIERVIHEILQRPH